MSIGQNIKNRRTELRMSQQELADAMGYKTRSTIAKIESGENDVSQKKLIRFAAALNTSLEDLITGVEKPAVSPAPPPFMEQRKNKNIVIILAGGASGQNRQNIPSQFVSVQGKPILVHCMDAYQAHPSIDDIYVVCLKGWERIVKAYALQHGITKLKGLIPGGESGILSLKNGIDHIHKWYSPNDIVFIQEATRPMINTETISKLLQACTESGSATIGHSMTDYVQFMVSGSNAKYVDRRSLVALQSPEAHRLELITTVFDSAIQTGHSLTESCCTMLLYNLGYNINFIEGNFNNIKIVHEEDIAAFGAMVRD